MIPQDDLFAAKGFFIAAGIGKRYALSCHDIRRAFFACRLVLFIDPVTFATERVGWKTDSPHALSLNPEPDPIDYSAISPEFRESLKISGSQSTDHSRVRSIELVIQLDALPSDSPVHHVGKIASPNSFEVSSQVVSVRDDESNPLLKRFPADLQCVSKRLDRDFIRPGFPDEPGQSHRLIAQGVFGSSRQNDEHGRVTRGLLRPGSRNKFFDYHVGVRSACSEGTNTGAPRPNSIIDS